MRTVTVNIWRATFRTRTTPDRRVEWLLFWNERIRIWQPRPRLIIWLHSLRVQQRWLQHPPLGTTLGQFNPLTIPETYLKAHVNAILPSPSTQMLSSHPPRCYPPIPLHPDSILPSPSTQILSSHPPRCYPHIPIHTDAILPPPCIQMVSSHLLDLPNTDVQKTSPCKNYPTICVCANFNLTVSHSERLLMPLKVHNLLTAQDCSSNTAAAVRLLPARLTRRSTPLTDSRISPRVVHYPTAGRTTRPYDAVPEEPSTLSNECFQLRTMAGGQTPPPPPDATTALSKWDKTGHTTMDELV
jgi:hypothetical protein